MTTTTDTPEVVERADTAAYRYSTEAPDLMGALRIREFAVATYARPEAARIDEFVDWLDSDSLDWDAVADARSNGW